MSTTHFSNLTEDCVQLIFDRIPTQQLLFQHRRVCRSWQRQQRINCRRRKSLIIVQGVQSLDEFLKPDYNKPILRNGKFAQENKISPSHKLFIDHNRIHIAPSEKEKSLRVKFLVHTFPQLTTLIMLSDDHFPMYVQSYSHLVEHYSAKLVTFQLYFAGRLVVTEQRESISRIINRLIGQLNSMSSLSAFVFEAPLWPIQPPIGEPEFLTRIKTFYIDCGRLVDLMLNWLKKYNQADRLDQLTRIYSADSVRVTRRANMRIYDVRKVICVTQQPWINKESKMAFGPAGDQAQDWICLK